MNNLSLNQDGYYIQKDFLLPQLVYQFGLWAMNPENIHRGNAVDGKYYAEHDGKRLYNVWWTKQPPVEMWKVVELMLQPIADIFFDGKPSQVHVVDTITTRPGSEKMFAHIDTPYKWEEFRNMNEVLGLQVIIPLDDFTVENGATMFWPGSHTMGFKHEDLISDVPKYNQMLLENGQQFVAHAGDALIYDGRTLHSTMPNNSDDFRSALLVNFLRSDIVLRVRELDKNTDFIKN